ncbi:MULTISPECIES: hypothetical protein [unclassified Paenibacillus]|uniref:hypothetical protein n=1 Tax=unclassified Paenibacillus TaxID=185978 RepID=UPI00034E4C2D|nr:MULTISPECIES: hypothetical protein [unclassified Paenibacillus]EPD80539.1 hypothetical protein HMPREF1207_05645 [Paenibacillus sp. HGH0039]
MKFLNSNALRFWILPFGALMTIVLSGLLENKNSLLIAFIFCLIAAVLNLIAFIRESKKQRE